MNPPKPLSTIQKAAIEAMDQSVDRLSHLEAELLAVFSTHEATLRQSVSFRNSGMPLRVVASLQHDALAALKHLKQKLAEYQDAADDVVVTAGAAVAVLESPDDETHTCNEPTSPPWAWVAEFAQLLPLPLGRTLPANLPALSGMRAGAVLMVEKGLPLLAGNLAAIVEHAPHRYGDAGRTLAEDLEPALRVLAELRAHAALLATAATCYAAAYPNPGFAAAENQAMRRLLDGGRIFVPPTQ